MDCFTQLTHSATACHQVSNATNQVSQPSFYYHVFLVWDNATVHHRTQTPAGGHRYGYRHGRRHQRPQVGQPAGTTPTRAAPTGAPAVPDCRRRLPVRRGARRLVGGVRRHDPAAGRGAPGAGAAAAQLHLRAQVQGRRRDVGHVHAAARVARLLWPRARPRAD